MPNDLFCNFSMTEVKGRESKMGKSRPCTISGKFNPAVSGEATVKNRTLYVRVKNLNSLDFLWYFN